MRSSPGRDLSLQATSRLQIRHSTTQPLAHGVSFYSRSVMKLGGTDFYVVRQHSADNCHVHFGHVKHETAKHGYIHYDGEMRVMERNHPEMDTSGTD